MTTPSKPKSWRDVLPIHPAALKMPPYSEAELIALGEDIRKNGLVSPITIFKEVVGGDRVYRYSLLDGINRLDAMERAGIKFEFHRTKIADLVIRSSELDLTADVARCREVTDDPYALVISANIHRRHLTAEDRQNLLIELIARSPTKSDRQIGKGIGVDHKTIARARAKGEDVGRIPHVETRTDTNGRQQPAHKSAAKRDDIEDCIAEASAAPKRPAPELPSNDVEAAEKAAAQFLYELEDLNEEYIRITDEMAALGARLCASLDMREGETFAEFIYRHDPERGHDSDKPQVLIASIACTLLHSEDDDLHIAIRLLNHTLAEVLNKRSASAVPSSPQPDEPKAAEPPPEMVECPACHGTGNMDDDGIPEVLRRQPSS